MVDGSVTDLQQTGATDRFYALVWPHAAMVLRAARMMTRDHAVAEDLSQETLLKAYRAIDRVQEQRGVLPWLMTILRNSHIDHLRSRQATLGKAMSLEAMEMDVADADAADPAGSDHPERIHPGEASEALSILEQLSDQRLIDAMQSLPEAIRFTLLLADVIQLDYADIARMLEIPVGTVKSRVHRGHGMLREMLTAQADPQAMHYRKSKAGEP